MNNALLTCKFLRLVTFVHPSSFHQEIVQQQQEEIGLKAGNDRNTARQYLFSPIDFRFPETNELHSLTLRELTARLGEAMFEKSWKRVKCQVVGEE